MKKIILFMTVLLLAACGNTVNDSHVAYLEDKGWSIKERTDEETVILDLPEEMLNNYEASGILFIRDYLGAESKRTTYLLKEKDEEGNHLKALIYEIDDEIIGSYGILQSWTPGLFDLQDQTNLKSQ